MIYYLILIVLLFLSLLAYGYSKNLSVILMGFILWFFSAFRFNAGYDYFEYYFSYERQSWLRFEPGSKLLVYISHLISEPQFFFFATSSIIICLFTMYFVRSRQQISNEIGTAELTGLGYLFFALLPIGFLDSLGVVRQFVAVTFFLYALTFIHSSKAKFIIIMLIGTLFHKALILFIPIVFFREVLERPRSLLFYALMMMASLIIGYQVLYAGSMALGLYSTYFTAYATTMGYKIYLLFVIIFMLYLYYKDEIFLSKTATLNLNIYFIGLCLYSAALPFGTHIARISWFFLAVHPLLFTVVLQNRSTLIKFSMISSAVLVFLVSLYIASMNEQRDYLGQYKFYFFSNSHELDVQKRLLN